jgi:hypothetical protein
MADNVHQVWSDDELDRALSALHSDVRTDERAMHAARAELLSTAGIQPSTVDILRSRGWLRWAVAAAAVVALAAGLLVIQTVRFGDRTPTASAAAALLNSAADKINASDPALGPTQFRYVGTHAWWMSTTVHRQTFSYLAENLLETWVPADQTKEWLWRRDVTGKRKWVQGTEEQARAAGIPVDETGWPEGEWRAPCGDFFATDEGKQPCTEPGSWSRPTPDFLAGLPRDPDQLFNRLKTDAPGNKRGDAEILVTAADALRSGLIPADLRAALYRALGKLPNLEITEQVANLDGRRGTAYGLSNGSIRQEIIVDPTTGEFIGERETAARDLDSMPAGTVMTYTSVTTAVVDTMGTRP